MDDRRWRGLSPSEFYQLQECLSYSPKRLKDLLGDMNDSNGVLAKYNKEKPMDYTGFKAFMKIYLEIDIPEKLSEDLFLSFVKKPVNETGDGAGAEPWFPRPDASAEGKLVQGAADARALAIKTSHILLKDLVCYMCLLEASTAEEKLEFTFNLYDTDGNGVLDSSEVDSIINHMMNVAHHLGWDVSELKPILEEMMHEIDYDADGTVTLDEWKHGGLTNVPLLVLLGLDKNVQDDGSHVWRLKHFHRPAYCNLCLGMLVGFGKQGLACKFCRYTVHERCAMRAPLSCIATYVKSRKASKMLTHHWVEGNCSGKCSKCKKSVKAYNSLTGLRCRWCHMTVHNKCSSGVPNECSIGDMREHLVSPTSIFPSALLDRPLQKQLSTQSQCLSRQTSTLGDEAVFQGQFNSFQIFPPPDTKPLVVFVNPKSGGKQGSNLLQKLQGLLNPRQVFNLLQGGPGPGLKAFELVDNWRVMVAGGDGTVGWLLEAMDKMTNAEKRPPVVVLPLGTGNDLARCLRWGGGYNGESLRDILKAIVTSSVVMLDRWRIEFSQEEADGRGNGSDDHASSKGDPVPANIFNNYFSVGVDASIAHKFHTMREKHPERFNSRMRNKLWYLEFSTSETLFSSCKNLHEDIDIMCDGVSLDLANGPPLEGIALLNIPSIHGGSNLWGDLSTKKRRSSATSLKKEKENIAAGNLLNAVQDIGDKLIEVVGVDNPIQLGAIRTGLKASGRRLAQCSSVVLRTRKRLPMQIDGEPWIQPPCTISISHKNQVPMCLAPEADGIRSCFGFL